MKNKIIWINLGGSLLLSLFFIFVGTDSLTDIFQSSQFTEDFLSSFVISFILLSYLSYCIRYLERRYSWQREFGKRIRYQLATGILLPSLFVLSAVSVYLFILSGYGIEEAGHFFYTEFPIAVLVIISINLAYAVWFFYQDNLKQSNVLVKLEQQLYTLQNVIRPADSLDNGIDRGDEPFMPAQENKIRTFIAVSGNKNIPIHVNDICYFYKQGNYTQLKMFEGKEYMLNHTLDELMRLLYEQDFFRVNRQFIVNFKACNYFTNEDNGKLALVLDPEHTEEIIISQKRSAEFREWLNK